MTVPDFLNVPEDMLDQSVATWEPKVGDRVRVRLSGECTGLLGCDDRLYPHNACEDGTTGVVVDWNLSPDADDVPGHPYEVCFDDTHEHDGCLHLSAAPYAPHELEPA